LGDTRAFGSWKPQEQSSHQPTLGLLKELGPSSREGKADAELVGRRRLAAEDTICRHANGRDGLLEARPTGPVREVLIIAAARPSRGTRRERPLEHSRRRRKARPFRGSTTPTSFASAPVETHPRNARTRRLSSNHQFRPGCAGRVLNYLRVARGAGPGEDNWRQVIKGTEWDSRSTRTAADAQRGFTQQPCSPDLLSHTSASRTSREAGVIGGAARGFSGYFPGPPLFRKDPPRWVMAGRGWAIRDVRMWGGSSQDRTGVGRSPWPRPGQAQLTQSLHWERDQGSAGSAGKRSSLYGLPLVPPEVVRKVNMGGIDRLSPGRCSCATAGRGANGATHHEFFHALPTGGP